MNALRSVFHISLLIAGSLDLWAADSFQLRGAVQGAHDPSIIRERRTFYVFTTGRAADGGQLGVRCSENLLDWRMCGHVFEQIPSWIRERSPQTKDLWAPDISRTAGHYRLYYAYSIFGKNTSGIALATTPTLDRRSKRYSWRDEGVVINSSTGDDYNAIDPNYVEDQSHGAWLVFGSFWSGIKMRALDRTTGKLSTTNTRTYSLAGRQSRAAERPSPNADEAIEAPYIVRHGDFYYLFVSWDLCCRGAKSTYKTAVGRSREISGPYLDRAGVDMRHGGGTLVLTGNERWRGPGGASVFKQRHKHYLLAFHAYYAVTGNPALQLSAIQWKEGWPTAKLPNH